MSNPRQPLGACPVVQRPRERSQRSVTHVRGSWEDSAFSEKPRDFDVPNTRFRGTVSFQTRRLHDRTMRLLWSKPKNDQLELLDADPGLAHESSVPDARQHSRQRALPPAPSPSSKATPDGKSANAGRPLLVPLDRLIEDPNNPRTEFPDAEIDELADSIHQHGILQPLVVSPADATGRHRIHHGAKRNRAARRAGLNEVPVVVRDAPADPYAQAAENQKRHGLTPMDLARLIRRQADAGDSNATIAKRLGLDQTTIAHHLALLELPPELNEAMQAGRCTSPRTLYELNKLHRDEPERARALLVGDGEITRSNVSAARTESAPTAHAPTQRRAQPPLLAQADAACARLELVLERIAKAAPRVADADLEVLKQRIASLGIRLA
jgi:ParB family transcriptional regulator, chromosome partitioning protein